MITLSAIDTIIVFGYFAAVLVVGFRARRKKTTQASEADFLLAGRSLTLPVFVMTLVSTWYGGILGVGEFSYRHGISNWFVQGVPYYLFAAVFAAVLAKKIRDSNLYTIPDKLEHAYDRRTALLGSVLTFLLMTPAPYVLMLSVFLQMLFGWSLAIGCVVAGIVAISYLFTGGFRADVQTDILQFVLMFAGFAVVLPFCGIRFGGFDFLEANLPPLHLAWHGGNSIQFILVWFFIALWTLVDPAFHQRCYAAKDGRVAQRGIFVSIAFWLIFDAMTATAGLYARAAIPHLEEPMMAFPMLAETVLPPVAKGLFYVGMLATIVSTLNTLAFVSAQTLGRDIVGRVREGAGRSEAHGSPGRWARRVRGQRLYERLSSWSLRNEQKSGFPVLEPATQNRTGYSFTLWTRVGLVVSFLLSILISLLFPSVVQLWYTIGTLIVPGLLVPLVASYFDRLRFAARYAFWSMASGWLTSLGWFIAGRVGDGAYPLGIEPMYPGLAASLAWWVVGRLAASRGTGKLE